MAQVRRILDAACRGALAQAAAPLSEDEAREEVRRLLALAPLEARFDPEPRWETIAVLKGGPERWRRSPEAAVRSPFTRSLLGLVRRFREEAKLQDVRDAWEIGRRGLYGAHVEVTDLAIAMRTAGDDLVGGTRRSRAEALALAAEFQAGLRRGASFDSLLARVEEAGRDDLRVERLRLYATDRHVLLRERALGLADGEVSAPIETLAEVHLLRREREVAALPFEDLEPLVRERLARERAGRWLDDRLADPRAVPLRWPLPLLP
jgi:hypothetical protein